MTRGLAAALAFAARRHSVVTTGELHACGVGSAAISRLVAAGLLRRRHRSVYVVGPSEPPHARAMAALLACGPHAALSHHAAAALWEIRRAPNPAIDIIHPGSARAHTGLRTHRMSLDGQDVGVRLGMRVTTPARTLLDLASVLDARHLARAVEEARVLRLVGLRDLHDVIGRAGIRPGVPALRRSLAALEDAPSLTRSEAERRLLELVRAARLDAPLTNVRVGRHEVDLLWRNQRLIAEVDGYRFHASRSAFERDRRRDGELLALGYRVLRVTWRELTEAPEAVIANLARALATRAA